MSNSMAKIIPWLKTPELSQAGITTRLTAQVLLGLALFTAGCGGAQVSLENQFPTPCLSLFL